MMGKFSFYSLGLNGGLSLCRAISLIHKVLSFSLPLITEPNREPKTSGS